MAWVRLVKRSECVEEADYAFDVTTGRRFVPAPNLDLRYLPRATTTDHWRTGFVCPPTEPRKCARHEGLHGR